MYHIIQNKMEARIIAAILSAPLWSRGYSGVKCHSVTAELLKTGKLIEVVLEVADEGKDK